MPRRHHRTIAAITDAMKEPFELVHRNLYRLSCRPDPTPEGTFLARVLVSWIDASGEALNRRLRPELAPFATASEAASAGRDAAVHWLETALPSMLADRHETAPPATQA
jgi:hypothetical protein